MTGLATAARGEYKAVSGCIPADTEMYATICPAQSLGHIAC